jgi:NADH:ubiquinone oxidoreductase subunit F (NADH-binding)
VVALLEHQASSFDEYVGAGGGRGLERALAMAPQQVIDEVALSGLRGRGGAGFPTGRKWLAVRSTGTGPRYVVCNAAEGEPATFKDRLLIRRNPYRLLDGVQIAAHAVGAEQAFIGLKETFTTEAEVLARALGEMQTAGALPVPVEILAGPDHYLLGEETGLLEMIEDRDPLPRVARPYYLGLFAKPPDENPTAVNNVETLSNVSHILAEGPDWLRGRGTEASPGTMLITLAGDVERDGVYEADLGTSMLQAACEAAGGSRSSFPAPRVQHWCPSSSKPRWPSRPWPRSAPVSVLAASPSTTRPPASRRWPCCSAGSSTWSRAPSARRASSTPETWWSSWKSSSEARGLESSTSRWLGPAQRPMGRSARCPPAPAF